MNNTTWHGQAEWGDWAMAFGQLFLHWWKASSLYGETADVLFFRCTCMHIYGASLSFKMPKWKKWINWMEVQKNSDVHVFFSYINGSLIFSPLLSHSAICSPPPKLSICLHLSSHKTPCYILLRITAGIPNIWVCMRECVTLQGMYSKRTTD